MKLTSPKSSLAAIFIIVGVLATTGVVAWTIQGKKAKSTPVRAVTKVHEHVAGTAITYNHVLLKKVTDLANQFNRLNASTISGYLTIYNPADTMQNITHEQFKFSKKDNESYYGLGAAELLNADSLNVFINHEQKSIVLTGQQPLIAPVAIDIEKFKNRLEFGDYELTSKSSGKSKIISIINEGNMDCKEYSITYDTVTSAIRRIYTRMGDINHPFDKASDKVFDIVITSIKHQSDIKKDIINGKVLYRKNNHWLLSDNYTDYDLIQH